MTATPRDAGLDALRAAATLLVLFAHGGYLLFAAFPHYDVYAFAGWIGTDVFFALSGYLVTRSLLAAPAHDAGFRWRYVARRLWRILPLYWVFLVVNVALAQATARSVPADVVAYAGLWQNLAWPHPAFFGEAWNLPVLVLFSVAAPGLVLGASTPTNRLRIATVGMALLVAIGIALRAVWVLDGDPSWDEGVRKIVVTRLDACAFGALAACAMAVRATGAGTRRIASAVAVGSCLLALAFFASTVRDGSDIARIATFALSCAGAAAACIACDGAITRRVPPVAAALSRWSYALYLANMPVLFSLQALGWGQSDAAGEGVLRFALWIAITLGAGAFVHRWIERPLLVRFPARA